MTSADWRCGVGRAGDKAFCSTTNNGVKGEEDNKTKRKKTLERFLSRLIR